MTPKVLMESAPIEWERLIDLVSSKRRGELVRELEAISIRAGILARYIDERHGYGCGDQGHEKAVKRMNCAGKIIHMKVFGYNAYHGLSI